MMIRKKLFVCLISLIIAISFEVQADAVSGSVNLEESKLQTDFQIDSSRREIYYNGEIFRFEHYIDNVYLSHLIDDVNTELIVVTKRPGTAAAIDYSVYRILDEKLILTFQRDDIYKGSIKLVDKKIIEKSPAYRKGDSNALPSAFKVDEYEFNGDTFVLTNSRVEEVPTFNSLETGQYENPPREEIEAMIEEVAMKRGIPPIILKSIAYTESSMMQFKDGEPLKAPRDEDSWGIMQVNLFWHPEYDAEKIKYDIRYNIEAGADILFSNWWCSFSDSKPRVKVGNGDQRILENWYFAIWGYNGWSIINNPNGKNYEFPYEEPNSDWYTNLVYQDKVLYNALYEFGQKILIVSKEELPDKNTEMGDYINYQINTPEPSHMYDFEMYKEGEILIDITEQSGLVLRDKNNEWEIMQNLSPGTAMKVIDGSPESYDGYLRYEVKVIKNRETSENTGWIAINWADKMRNSDINSDGITDIFDLVGISKNMGKSTADSENLKLFDLNYDNSVDLFDIVLAIMTY